MTLVALKTIMSLGGRVYEAGEHEIELVRDWFVEEMERVGLLEVKEGNEITPSIAQEVLETTQVQEVAPIEEVSTPEPAPETEVAQEVIATPETE